MKRILLSAIAAAISISGFSQVVPHYQLKPELRHQAVLTKHRLDINQNPGESTTAAPAISGRQVSAIETEIGDTRYDLQTNSAIQRRIINHTNGTVSATWTYSAVNSWATRGTGYNYFNGSSWGTAPTSQIES